MTWQDRIEVNEAILAGKPIVKGSCLAVEFLIELLAGEKVYPLAMK